MTRAQIIEGGQNLLGEVTGTEAAGNPFSWDRLVTEEVDTLARATYCYWVRLGAEVTAGQPDFCAPPVFRITGVEITVKDGSTRTLPQVRPETLDNAYGTFAYWRNNPSQGDPYCYVSAGLNAGLLYPAPNYSSVLASVTDLVMSASGLSSAARPFTAADVGRTVAVTGGTGWTVGRYPILAVTGIYARLDGTAAAVGATLGQANVSAGGLMIEGYACPGDTWPNAPDVCPLVERAHPAVMYGAALGRIMQFPTPDNLRREPMIQARYREMRGKLEREAASFSGAQRGSGR